MLTHAYHTPDCPEAKGEVGPILGAIVTIAGIVGPLNIIPQIWKIFETKSVANVSLLTYLIVILIQVVWLVYAHKLSLRPLLISSIAVIALGSIVVIQFFVYGGQLFTL